MKHIYLKTTSKAKNGCLFRRDRITWSFNAMPHSYVSEWSLTIDQPREKSCDVDISVTIKKAPKKLWQQQKQWPKIAKMSFLEGCKVLKTGPALLHKVGLCKFVFEDLAYSSQSHKVLGGSLFNHGPWLGTKRPLRLWSTPEPFMAMFGCFFHGGWYPNISDTSDDPHKVSTHSWSEQVTNHIHLETIWEGTRSQLFPKYCLLLPAETAYTTIIYI